MRRRVLAIGFAGTLASATAWAGPRRVLVLPVDGTVEATRRAQLSDAIRKAAGTLDDVRVEAGNATLRDAAAVAGCDPADATCVDQIRTTLGVDELVYASATPAPAPASGVTLVVHRHDGTATHDVTIAIAPDDPPDAAQPALRPLFHPEEAPQPLPAVPKPPPPVDHTRRNWAIAAAVGGGTFLIIGLSLWSSASGLASQVDMAPLDTRAQIDAARELEDRARNRALLGDVMVLGGLALGGYGGWVLYQERSSQVTVAPVVAPTGAAVVLRWGPR